MFDLSQIKIKGRSRLQKISLTVEDLEEASRQEELKNISFEEYQKMIVEAENIQRPIRIVKNNY